MRSELLNFQCIDLSLWKEVRVKEVEGVENGGSEAVGGARTGFGTRSVQECLIPL